MPITPIPRPKPLVGLADCLVTMPTLRIAPAVAASLTFAGGAVSVAEAAEEVVAGFDDDVAVVVTFGGCRRETRARVRFATGVAAPAAADATAAAVGWADADDAAVVCCCCCCCTCACA